MAVTPSKSHNAGKGGLLLASPDDITSTQLLKDYRDYYQLPIDHDKHYSIVATFNGKAYPSYSGGLRACGDPPNLSKDDYTFQLLRQRMRKQCIIVHHAFIHLCPWFPFYRGVLDLVRVRREFDDRASSTQTYRAFHSILATSSVSAFNNCFAG